MKRLDILLVGTSPALAAVHAELEQHGHVLYLATDLSAPEQPLQVAPQLVIEDGSLPLPYAAETDVSGCTFLSLRLGSSTDTQSLLPDLELRCWTGSRKAQRLIAHEVLPMEPSGNGQQLRLQAIARLRSLVALQVGRLSRNPDYLLETPTISGAQFAQEHGLMWLEQLAFVHLFNSTRDEQLLKRADVPVIEWLERSFKVFADNPALNLNGHRLSYAQLHAQALAIQQQLIPHLPAHWAQPPVIAICLPKSLALYASLLAVLGCAAVYLPMDPNHPAERLQYILDNAGAALLIHDASFSPNRAGLPTLDLSQLPAAPQTPLSSLIHIRAQSEAPSVAIYTSGTTGHPKGVLLSQRNLSHFQHWYAEHVQLKAHSRVLQFSTISFDASLLDILPTWACGAELVIPDEDQRRDPQRLLELIQREAVTHAFLPPALLSILPLKQMSGVNHLITGGDVCEPEVIEHLAEQCSFHNIYGPTETTVLATTRVFACRDNNRNLGRPIANCEVFILDEHLQPVVEQTPGELYIAGPGVGLGYLGNPQLNAERFLLLDLPDGRQLRVYRTGDVGKWTEHGIEICGRRDNQVKIRGFRVEPEEVEHCLRASKLYRQVAVVVDQQRRLLAFAAQPRQADAKVALRRYAEQQLPDYMCPAFYQELPNMPYTANGKIDRQALRARPVQLGPQNTHVAPRNDCEQRVLSIWSALLELPADHISCTDSFFNLGGHSILLSRLLLDVRETFGRSIPINRFIEMPTLQRMAMLLGDEDNETSTLDPQARSDAERALDLQVQPIDCLGDVHKVIVTGANSFLGVHIVEALLDWGASEVACLVRRNATHSAAERFTQAVTENQLQGLDLNRVRVFEADLRQPKLGLNEADYDYLDRHYGALIHNGAHVNHVLDYQALAADNVEPLFACLRLCEGQRKKIFNFVSTLSACSAIDNDGKVLEQPPAQTPPIYIRNGYNLSKWVGERILERARAQGVWVNLYRPGNITFDSRNGVCQPHKNRLMLMLKGSLQLGQVPALELNFDLMPVDFLARFIAFHTSRYRPEQAVFNLHNPEPLSWQAYIASFRDIGRPFELVEVEQWQQQLQRVDRNNALFEVLGFYLNGFEEDIGDTSRIDHDNAREGVSRMGERYPAKNPALLQRGCRYLQDIQFI